MGESQRRVEEGGFESGGVGSVRVDKVLNSESGQAGKGNLPESYSLWVKPHLLAKYLTTRVLSSESRTVFVIINSEIDPESELEPP